MGTLLIQTVWHAAGATKLRLLALLEGRPLARFARQQPVGFLSGLVIVAFAVLAAFAGPIAPYSPTEQHYDSLLVAPNSDFWFGTDNLGRDVLSRVIYGSRLSLQVGFSAVVIAVVFGASIGLVSGYLGGVVDTVVQRVMDTVMVVPMLLLALLLVSLLGPSKFNVILAISVVLVPRMNRVVRGNVLSVKETQYVEAAKAVGCGPLRIMVLHILPNLAAAIIVVATIDLSAAILTEAFLSFLGLGTPPQVPSWGQMLSAEGRRYLENAPWLGLFPGLALSLLILAFNLLGDALRDVLDPRLRRARRGA